MDEGIGIILLLFSLCVHDDVAYLWICRLRLGSEDWHDRNLCVSVRDKPTHGVPNGVVSLWQRLLVGKKKKKRSIFFWSPLSSERFPSACAPLSRPKSGEDPADPHAPLFRKTLAAATPPQMHPGLQMHLTFLRTNPGCAGASLRGERWVSPFAWSFFSLREREKILRLETCCDGSQNEKQCAYVRSNETHVKKIRERDERVPRNKET